MARMCWAHAMGNCAEGKLTREHIVPVAAFEGDSRSEREALPATVVLTHATGAQTERHLTVKNFTTNTLCAAHNEELSPLANTLATTTAELGKLLKVLAARAPNPLLPWGPKCFEIPGQLLWRALLNQTVNHCIAHDKGAPFVPATALVAAIFGQRDASGAQGVYFEYREGARLLLGEERFRIEPGFLTERDDDGRALAYAKVGFRNFPFVVIADARLQPEPNWLRMWPSPPACTIGFSVALGFGLSLRCD